MGMSYASGNSINKQALWIYLEFNKKWMQSSYYERINFKDNKVCDLNNNELILNTIFNANVCITYINVLFK